MSFLSDFEHDIFISYARVDNQKDWVTRFQDELENALNPLLGKKGAVKIWRDTEQIDGEQVFDQTIRTAIEKSALFLALYSNGYQASRFCKDELTWFHQKISNEPYGAKIDGDRSRIYNVLLRNIHHEDWLPELKGISGHSFHDAEEREEDLGWPSAIDSELFQEQLRELAEALFKMLSKFKDTLLANRTPNHSGKAGHEEALSVYFAEVTDPLRKMRKRVTSELSQKGITVLGPVPPPTKAVEHEREAVAAIRRATLSVHLFDDFTGKEIEDDTEHFYTHKQVELAKTHAQAQIIWVPPGLDLKTIEDSSHKDLLNDLEHGVRGRANYEFWRDIPPEGLTQNILAKLKHLRERPKPLATTSAVLLDTFVDDQPYALEQYRILWQNNIQPYINPQGNDPTQIDESLKTRLKQVSSLIILFGCVDETWVRHRLAEIVKLSIACDYPIDPFFILLAPPAKKNTEFHFNFKVHVIDSIEPVLRHFAHGGRA